MGGLTSKKRLSIQLFGLDGSGRTTIVEFLKTGKKGASVIPTVGFNVEEI